MKSKREMDSKAGTSKKQNKNIFSKSASMLLIAIAGFSMMSFTQDETTYSDTNANVTAEAVSYTSAYAAPVSEDEPKKLKFKGNPKETLKADLENSRNFFTEVKERRIWGTTLAEALKVADNEAVHNFAAKMLVPTEDKKMAADMEAVRIFEASRFTNAVVASLVKADAEAQDLFWKENFYIKVSAATANDDMIMFKAFRDAQVPTINISFKKLIAAADAEAKNDIATDAKSVAGK